MNFSQLQQQLSATELRVLLFYGLVNVICLFLYVWDKAAARRHGQRISEQQLLFWTLLSGGITALMAQQSIRHKTQKPVFQWVAIIGFLLHLLLWIYIISL
ncbi:DUF1294 domain-containing protein [Undibacterium sp. Ji22W]|jgi:uncharacterized membrane protein YsdA (DUF1294 family)|uniref:DUF1294 domain-containing protein n=1 Tax=Undibacterium sp. Ji22W TaxID=3413038 RepID=UPI003BF226D4